MILSNSIFSSYFRGTLGLRGQGIVVYEFFPGATSAKFELHHLNSSNTLTIRRKVLHWQLIDALV